MLLCEAAGYRNILVETVGVGQSETAVRSMTDFFLLLMLAGAGDELQGMKRGIIEMIDGMAINKADGDNKPKAERARVEYASALHLFPPPPDGWTPRVLTCSALTGKKESPRSGRWSWSIAQLLEGNGFLAQRRNGQALQWMNELIHAGAGGRCSAATAPWPRGCQLLREEVPSRAHDALRGQPRAADTLPPRAQTKTNRQDETLCHFPFLPPTKLPP